MPAPDSTWRDKPLFRNIPLFFYLFYELVKKPNQQVFFALPVRARVYSLVLDYLMNDYDTRGYSGSVLESEWRAVVGFSFSP